MYVPFAKGNMHPQGRAVATPGIFERVGEWRTRLLKCPGRTCARFVASHVTAPPYVLAGVQRAFHVSATDSAARPGVPPRAAAAPAF